MGSVFSRIFATFLFLPFVCAAGQWPDIPVDISNPGQNASNPQIAVNLNGDAVAVWIENNIVQSRSGSVSGGWSSTIDTLSSAGASDPQVIIDVQGNATAIWVENTVVNASSKPSGGSWSGSSDVLSGTGSSSPKIAVDIDGNVIALWVENGFVLSATRLFGGAWPGTPDTISAAGSSFPRIAIGTGGTAVAVWQGIIDSTPTVYAASKQVTGSWASAEAISSADLNSGYPQVTVDLEGKATAVWFSYNVLGSAFSNVILQSSSLPLNGSWSTPINISSPGIRNPADLVSHVIACPNGVALAVWTTTYNGTLFNIEWSLFSKGRWSSPALCVAQNLLALDVVAGVDAFGDVLLAWMYYDASNSSLVIQGALNDTMGVSQVFGGIWTLSNGGSNAYPVMSACNSASTIMGALAWKNYNGTSDVIQALITDLPYVQPPINLAVSQGVNNYGVLSEYYNEITWDPGPSPNITCYLIFRDGVYIAYVDSSIHAYIDRNRNQNQTVVYGVAAYDDHDLESDPANVVFP